MVKPETQALINGLQKLCDTFAAYQKALSAFQPSTFQDICPLVHIQNDNVDIEDQIKALTQQFQQTKLDLGETLALTDPIAKVSAPLLALLLAVGGARPKFTKAILGFLPVTPLIKGHLKEIKTLMDALMKQMAKSVDTVGYLPIETARVAAMAAFDTQISVTYLLDLAIYVPGKIPTLKS